MTPSTRKILSFAVLYAAQTFPIIRPLTVVDALGRLDFAALTLRFAARCVHIIYFHMIVRMICIRPYDMSGYGIWRILCAKCTLRLSWYTQSFYCSLIQLHIQPGAPCLPCCCCGPAIECDGCSICNAQAHLCCCVASAALPCNDEVPVALSVAGLTVYPKCGCCVPMKEIMHR